jgi:anti-sigma factor RsiW
VLERDGLRLMEYLDGTLPATERRSVEAWLAVDPEARRVLAQHRALWELLGEADPAAEPSASEEFRRRTLARASEPAASAWRARAVALLAASLLVSVVVFAWHDAESRSALADEDVVVVGNLDLLENLDFMDTHGRVLDDAVLAAALRAFEAPAEDAPATPETGGAR